MSMMFSAPGAVVREVDVRAVLRLRVHERRVHAGRHAFGELGDGFGCSGSSRVADDDAVLAVGGALARHDEVVAVGRRHHVVDRFARSTTIESTIAGLAGCRCRSCRRGRRPSVPR